ncbi:type II secretion system minor pseudopilin GspJ [Xanthomonas hortorum]|uniref:Type II secretion system protein J n=1 Tax=Xanthomonas hortorum pv. pelargonii TaxID=453602 RepID=A0A6V7C2V8_9XANT|nr:type II secretion system minor pseudopilin GspJ [Xanthomonas hortorum]MCE4355502.1 type II secretion system minor pseudopilin GspJ [Xanthomonas hortorum pv. pelargonii]MCM5524170.1 type II secretion system minor pseudopilin GspJ [Xanthomonas hortorum pv. pelargonii]MCM5536742.1 type II secretion system minor pseudopilin GspJ [Xanthomonas hortorum pv. pelargonii]MCM5539387.1 type II secretion system minor pseudopilin GspJ [Xanthomonas hortorum pv. pelargonii]MCM5544284.1 type II secretion sy
MIRARRAAVCTRDSAGFTLIELLVALAVFALVAVAAVVVMRQSIDQRDAVRARLQQIREFQLAHGLLRSDLQQAAVRRTRNSEGGAAREAFIASQPGVSGPLFGFVRRGWSNPDQAPRASLQYVEYRVVDGRLERSARPALDGAVAGTPQVVLRGVRSAVVGFHYRAQWSDGWSGGLEALPDAISLELDLEQWGRVRQLFVLPEGRG